jgi:hypothetical protein
MVFFGLLVGCDSSGSSSSLENDILPYLPSGQHLSMIVGFETYGPETTERVDDVWQQAMAAGMKVGRIQLDWVDLETAPGVYDEELLRNKLEQMKSDGLKSFVAINAIDSEGLVVPEDLIDEDSPTELVNGRSMNDPEVILRYKAVLDWAVPLIVEEGGWVLSIANEPDGYMEDRPDEVPKVVEFFATAIEYSHSIDPGLSVTVTLAGAPIIEKKFFHDDVMALLDAATYNYYPLMIDSEQFVFTLRSPLADYVSDDVDKLVSASMGKPVLIQELGCPAGYPEDSIIGTNPEAQAEFFRLFYNKLVQTPEVRAAFVFQLVDWSEELAILYLKVFQDDPEFSEQFLQSFAEWLETSGLITDEHGTARPALEVFLEAIEALR